MIVPFFQKYPSVSQKGADFELFKQIVEHINSKEHLTPAGLPKIVNLKASLNIGNSSKLKDLFWNAIPVARPLVKFMAIPNPHLLSGFTDADVCSYVSTYASPESKLGMTVQLVFVVISTCVIRSC